MEGKIKLDSNVVIVDKDDYDEMLLDQNRFITLKDLLINTATLNYRGDNMEYDSNVINTLLNEYAPYEKRIRMRILKEKEKSKDE